MEMPGCRDVESIGASILLNAPQLHRAEQHNPIPSKIKTIDNGELRIRDLYAWAA